MDGGGMEMMMPGEISEKEKMKVSAMNKGASPQSWVLGDTHTSSRTSTKRPKKPNPVLTGKENVENQPPPASRKGELLPEHGSKGIVPSDVYRRSPRLKYKHSPRPTLPGPQRSSRKAAKASSSRVSPRGRRRGKWGGHGSTTASGDGQTMRSMWDNVVAMMKTAVDAILFDDDGVETAEECVFMSPAKAESGMQLRTSEGSRQSTRAKRSASSSSIAPSKIKEAKNLDPTARKSRRRPSKKTLFSRSSQSQVTPSRHKASSGSASGSSSSSSSSNTSQQYLSPEAPDKELSVFNFRSSPLSKKVACVVNSSSIAPGQQLQQPSFGGGGGGEAAEGTTPFPRNCHMPLKHIPSRSSQSNQWPSPTNHRVPSPLCTPLFREISIQPQTSENGDTGIDRHAQARAITTSASPRQSGRSNSQRARASSARSHLCRASNADVSNRSPTPSVDAASPVNFDPLLNIRVVKSVMPVRAIKRLKGSSSISPAKKKIPFDDLFAAPASTAFPQLDNESIGSPASPPAVPPLLAADPPTQSESATAIPPPPPPPPPPALVHLSESDQPPCPPPLPGHAKPGMTPFKPQVAHRSSADRVLAGMQERLRTRMRQAKDTVANAKATKKSASDAPEVDPKISQWAAIQSKYRKMCVEDFLAMASVQRAAALEQIQALSKLLPTELPGVIQCVEDMAAATCWWPGGVKEMKETIPEWKILEPKLDIMEEYIKVMHSMEEVTAMPDMSQAEFHFEVSRLRDTFFKWHRCWSGALLSDARSWTELSLPVDTALLNRSRCYLAEVMLLMSHRVAEETALLHGKSIARSHRLAKQLSGMLQECLEYLTLALAIVKPAAASAAVSVSDDVHDSSAQESPEDDEHRLSALFAATKSAAVLCAQRHVELANAQYLAVVYKNPKQEVTGHFDGVLKTLGLLKTLARQSMDPSLPWASLAQKGVLRHFLETEDLGEAIYQSCASVLQHIMKVTQLTGDDDDTTGFLGEASPREMVLWLMFGCKYLNRCLEILGDDGHGNIKELLDSLEKIEDSLPA